MRVGPGDALIDGVAIGAGTVDVGRGLTVGVGVGVGEALGPPQAVNNTAKASRNARGGVLGTGCMVQRHCRAQRQYPGSQEMDSLRTGCSFQCLGPSLEHEWRRCRSWSTYGSNLSARRAQPVRHGRARAHKLQVGKTVEMSARRASSFISSEASRVDSCRISCRGSPAGCCPYNLA